MLNVNEKDVSLSAALECIREDDRDKYDIDYVGNEHMVMNEDTGLIHIRKKDQNFAMSKNATKQLCRHFEIPLDFWEKQLDSIDRSYIFNKFCKTRDAEFFVRCRDNGNDPHMIRAFLSHRYVPMDNRFIIDRVESFMKEYGDTNITNFYMDDNRLHFRFIDPEISIELGKNTPDPIYGGVHIANSETGIRNATIESLVYRMICTNGAMGLAKEPFMQVNHNGTPEEDFVMGYKEAIRQALDCSKNAFEKFEQAASSDKMLQENSDVLIDVMVNKTKINAATKDEIVKDFKESSSGNLYDFVNAITLKAQNLDWEKRYTLEKHAGVILMGNVA